MKTQEVVIKQAVEVLNNLGHPYLAMLLPLAIDDLLESITQSEGDGRDTIKALANIIRLNESNAGEERGDRESGHSAYRPCDDSPALEPESHNSPPIINDTPATELQPLPEPATEPPAPERPTGPALIRLIHEMRGRMSVPEIAAELRISKAYTYQVLRQPCPTEDASAEPEKRRASADAEPTNEEKFSVNKKVLGIIPAFAPLSRDQYVCVILQMCAGPMEWEAVGQRYGHTVEALRACAPSIEEHVQNLRRLKSRALREHYVKTLRAQVENAVGGLL